MGYGERTTVRRVREALEAKGVEPRIVELENTARSAKEAADALGVRVGQIVKSLVFCASESGRPVLVAASGPNRVDENRISDLLSEPIEKAGANFVREKTGSSACRRWGTPRSRSPSWTRRSCARRKYGPPPDTPTPCSRSPPRIWYASPAAG